MLLQALTKQFRDELEPSETAAATRVKLVDLNGDGIPEIIAQGIAKVCSPTGNCPVWVFQRVASGYKVILERGAVQSFTVQPTRSNGYFDIVLGMHGSATEQALYLYRFGQRRYRKTACYDANWSYLDENGKVHELKEPRITPCN